MDFSCADEIVAKLLMRFLQEDRPVDVLFVFQGVRTSLQEPIQTVLERQELLAVARDSEGRFELMGTRTEEEDYVWTVLEGRGWIVAAGCPRCFPALITERLSKNSCAGASHLRFPETEPITR